MSKSTRFIIIAVVLLAGIIIYVVVQNKQPSEEFKSLAPESPQSAGEQPSSQATKPSSSAQQPSAPAAAPAQTGSFGLAITSPASQEVYFRGAKYTIRWEGIFTDRVRVFLRRAGSISLELISGIYASVGKYEWTVPTSLSLASDYYIMIIPQIQSYSRAATSATFRLADSPAISATKSVVEASPTSVSAEPNCFATVTVRALNEYGLPLAGKSVSLSSSRNMEQIVAVRSTTASDGTALFRVGSQSQGTPVFSAIADGVLINDTAVVSFLIPPPFCTTR